MTNSLSVPRAVATGSSDLNKRQWAVIADHYLNFALTHDEAMAEARDLVARKQHAVVVTNAAAMRMVANTAGIAVASLPDMRF